MPAVNQNRARNTVLVMLLCGLLLCFAGHKYQQRQQAVQVTWQNVSDTMQEVEDAKQDLFKSLHAKAND